MNNGDNMFATSVSFPLNANWTSTNKKLVNLAKKHHGISAGSGAGLGKRDMQFEFKIQANALKFVEAADKIPDVETENVVFHK